MYPNNFDGRGLPHSIQSSSQGRDREYATSSPPSAFTVSTIWASDGASANDDAVSQSCSSTDGLDEWSSPAASFGQVIVNSSHAQPWPLPAPLVNPACIPTSGAMYSPQRQNDTRPYSTQNTSDFFPFAAPVGATGQVAYTTTASPVRDIENASESHSTHKTHEVVSHNSSRPRGPTSSYQTMYHEFYTVPLSLFSDPRWTGPFVPQKPYKPYTKKDKGRYVEDARLSCALYFESGNSCGVTLSAARSKKGSGLNRAQDRVFEDRGPSISIRIQWPGYDSWTKQIAAKNYRKPRTSITLEKLANEVDKVTERFFQETKQKEMDSEADRRWNIRRFTPNDLVLVSIHNVSQGSWQPHFRLLKPLEMYRLET